MSRAKIANFVVVTGNLNKLREINAILGTNHEVSTIDIPEIQSMDLEQVISAKAKYAYKILKKPVLVTDVSVEIEALNGLPGPFVKYFLQTLGPAKTVSLIKGKSNKAKVTDAIALFDGETLKIFYGTVFGTLPETPKGNSGFGFDVVFIPEGSTKTFAEMTADEKNSISHRSIALKKLRDYLKMQ